LHWTFGQNESVPEAKLREYLESLEADRKNLGKIIADASGREPDQVDLDVLAGRTLTADEARTYGLVHDVQNVQVAAGTELLHIQG